MSQADYDIADQNGLSFLAELNATLAAILSNNSGATEPETTAPYMWWPDTNAGILKQRNAADDGWVSILALGSTALTTANNLADLANAATAFNNIKQAATTTSTGVVEKATPTEMTNGTANKYPDCATVKNWVEANASVVPFSRVRQTVLTGPVDSNGRADFLVDGGGLSVDTSGLTLTPLIISYGDGFDATSGEVNLVVEIDADLTWSSLTDDAVNYLYVDYDDSGNVASTTASTLPPDYRQAPESEISSPSSGQFWYPTVHRSRGKTYNGSTWDSELRVCVGQATTSGGSVASVVSYAYQGRYSGSHSGFDAENSTYLDSLSHNVGLKSSLLKFSRQLVLSNSGAGLSVGDIIDMDAARRDFTSSSSGDNVITFFSPSNNSVTFAYDNNSIAFRVTGNGSSSMIPAGSIIVNIERAF